MRDKVAINEFNSYLATLHSDLRQYEIDIQRVFSRKLTRPRDCAKYFFEVLASTSRLYTDNLTLRKLEPRLPAKYFPGDFYEDRRRAARLGRAASDMAMRKRFSAKIESLPGWSDFHPGNEFVSENGLRKQSDYVFQLTLHLPEILGETLYLCDYVSCLLDLGPASGCSIEELMVRLEHIAHHASYCRHTLEILSREGTWRNRSK